jgi:hypothetical protein
MRYRAGIGRDESTRDRRGDQGIVVRLVEPTAGPIERNRFSFLVFPVRVAPTVGKERFAGPTDTERKGNIAHER